jgi:hypothetical protein
LESIVTICTPSAFGAVDAHALQNHFPVISVSLDKPTHAKWNHSTLHVSLSHAIISPKETRLHTQKVSSSLCWSGVEFGAPAKANAPACMALTKT